MYPQCTGSQRVVPPFPTATVLKLQRMSGLNSATLRHPPSPRAHEAKPPRQISRQPATARLKFWSAGVLLRKLPRLHFRSSRHQLQRSNTHQTSSIAIQQTTWSRPLLLPHISPTVIQTQTSLDELLSRPESPRICAGPYQSPPTRASIQPAPPATVSP